MTVKVRYGRIMAEDDRYVGRTIAKIRMSLPAAGRARVHGPDSFVWRVADEDYVIQDEDTIEFLSMAPLYLVEEQ